MQQRNDTITIMKAFAIICMVAGHSYTGSHIEGFVGLFHMPVFFFCSGYCFKEKYLSDHCCPVKILKYHLSSNSRNSVLDIQALI